MTSQPDKLFRDKLENFHRPAPVGAWDKIESKVSRTSKKVMRMRIAAGIALLTAAGIVLWPAQEKETHRVAVKQTENPALEKDSTPGAVEPVQQIEQHREKYAVAKMDRAHTKKENKVTPRLPEQKETAPEPLLVATPQPEERVAQAELPQQPETTSTTIVYTSAEVNSKFLKKKSPPEATPQPEEASHMQKLIGLAYAAKNMEDGLGDLRQKKDDLLALNFGKKKGEN